MIRIMIKWDFVSPTLQTVSGIVTLDWVVDTIVTWKTLAEFRVKVKPGTVSYSSLSDKGIPSIYLDAIKPQLDIMVRSYHRGVILGKDDFTWVIENVMDEARYALKKSSEKLGPEFQGKYLEIKTSERNEKGL